MTNLKRPNTQRAGSMFVVRTLHINRNSKSVRVGTRTYDGKEQGNSVRVGTRTYDARACGSKTRIYNIEPVPDQ